MACFLTNVGGMMSYILLWQTFYMLYASIVLLS